MTKEAKALIELIENNKEKARNINSLENTMELAYLKALSVVNDCNYSKEVTDYLIKLYSMRIKEIDFHSSKIIGELEEINNEKL